MPKPFESMDRIENKDSMKMAVNNIIIRAVDGAETHPLSSFAEAESKLRFWAGIMAEYIHVPDSFSRAKLERLHTAELECAALLMRMVSITEEKIDALKQKGL